MGKLFLAFVGFALVLLVSFGASASEWDCHVHGDVERGGKWYEKTLDIDVGIKEKAAAEDYARKQWEATYAADPSKRRGVVVECEPITKRAHAMRVWTCRIASRWLAVFDVGGKPVLRRGLEAFDAQGLQVSPDDKANARTTAAQKHAGVLRSGVLRGGRSIVVTIVAGECWDGAKPPRPNDWPAGIAW